jgi:hypothetical protein
MAVRLSALRTGRVLLPKNIISLLLSEPQFLVRQEGGGKLEKKSGLLFSALPVTWKEAATVTGS